MIHLVQTIAAGAGMSWASGIRLYAACFLAGMFERLHWLSLPGELKVLAHPVVLAVSGVFLLVEFLADKIPAVDSVWDAVHTFVRIPAGAALAAASLGDASPAVIAVAAIAGGGIATSAHLTKAGTRALVNTSPEPFSNIAVSFAEEATVLGGLWAAWKHPEVFLVGLVIFVACSVYVGVKAWSLLRRAWHRVIRRKSATISTESLRVGYTAIQTLSAGNLRLCGCIHHTCTYTHESTQRCKCGHHVGATK
jgi:hypothetical protein